MSEMRSVTRLIDRIRNGSRGEMEEAAQAIWDRYFPELLRVATQKLSPQVQARVDGEDVAAAACRTFFIRHANKKFDLANRDELWALLLTITWHKARKAVRAAKAGIRDVGRQQSAPDAGPDDEYPDWLTQSPDRSTPTADDALAAAEECERLLRMLDAEHRAVAQLKLEGYTHEEIAGKLGCVVRTVERRVERIRLEWTEAGYGPPDRRRRSPGAS